MTRDAKYSVIAFLSGAVVMGMLVFLSLDFEQVNWMKWFGFALWTAVIFGCLAYAYGESLKKRRPLVLFLAMLALHVSALVVYLTSVDRFPNVFFLFFSPLEAGVIAFILSLLGGVDLRRRHRVKRSPHQEWPPRD